MRLELHWSNIPILIGPLVFSDLRYNAQQPVPVVRPKVESRQMKSLRRDRRDKKGINTILASLLMVVIVVLAAVIVYAGSTGLLTSLLVQSPLPNQPLNY